MIVPNIALKMETPCLARVEVWGHRLFERAYVLPVFLSGMNLIAVVYTEFDFADSAHRMSVNYYTPSAIFSIQVQSEENFFKDMESDLVDAFRRVMGQRAIFDGSATPRKMNPEPPAPLTTDTPPNHNGVPRP